MNTIEKMHEVRLPNIYIVSHIICYIHPLILIIALAIKAVSFLRSIMVIWKIKYDFSIAICGCLKCFFSSSGSFGFCQTFMFICLKSFILIVKGWLLISYDRV